MIKPVGLHLDNSPIDQPENTARFVLNAVLDTVDGDMYSYSKERSNRLSYTLKEGYTLVGSVKLDGNNVILFSTNNSSSEIGLFNKGEYTELINTPCLGFNTNNLVKAKYRIIRGCERIIYFVDNLNTDKAINIDRLEDYRNDNDWDCNLMKLNPDYLIPKATILTVDNLGGNLESGSYAFAVELLDRDLNSVAVGTVTNYIPVYADNLSDSYNSIHGSLTTTSPTEEGASQTSKSITLQLSNLDESFEFARVIVIAKNTSRGIAEEAYELQDFVPISQGSINYTVTTLDNAVRTDVETVRVKSVKYTSSSAIDIVNSRLVRANTREDQRDYSNYQRVSNSISVRWKRVSENPLDITEEKNTKNPLSYQNGNTFLADEVYALGIQYIFQDGTISPVFHIPGRAATNNDTTPLKVGTDINVKDVGHLDLEIGETIPRWKFENTATGVSSGELSYFETDTTYPIVLDCDGEAIYGDLANQPIRHHKLPCRSNYPLVFPNSTNEPRVSKFGLEFDNITYPDLDIVGHRFVSAIRSESDKTVIDNGVLLGEEFFESSESEFNFVGLYKASNSSIEKENGETYNKVKAIVSPKILNGSIQDVDYIKIIGNRNREFIEQTNNIEFGQLQVSSLKFNLELSRFNDNNKYRSLVNTKLIGPNSRFNGQFPYPVANRDFSNNMLAIEMNDSLELSPAFDYNFSKTFVSLKKSIIPFRNLFQLNYEPITPILNLSDEQRTFNGKGFTNLFNVFNIRSILRGLTDTWIPEIFGSDTVEVTADYFSQIFLDSDVNYELRVEGTECNNIYNLENNLDVYTANKVATFDGSDWVLRGSICPEYYRYNDDYLPRSGETNQLPVPFNFDYCSKCLTKFPNRIVWSPKSFSEQITDNFRINLVNDFLTLGETKGQITNLHYEKNRLLVWTKDSIFLLTPNPRVINTDVDTAYVGTGDFLGVPAVEFSQVDHGFGGCQGRGSMVNTELGVIWADQQAGRIYMFDGQIKEVTTGLYTWMRKNLPKDNSDFRLKFSYDPYYKRVLISNSNYTDVNNSWTISYSLRYNTWCSWHTWHPEWSFSDRNTYYSSRGNTVWSHDGSSFNSFYGILGKFQIEFVDRQALTSDLDTVLFYATPSDRPGFNEFVIYNDNQSTGIQTLVDNVDYYGTWSNNTKVLVNAQDNYRISQIRNLNTIKPTTTSDWNDIQSEYTQDQGYIDKLPDNIDYNINQWKLEPLRHKYFQIRLISNTEDQIVFHLTQTTKRHKPL